jgi:endonuclease/exonuclease/phosphatase family metal-dependent hydrolase
MRSAGFAVTIASALGLLFASCGKDPTPAGADEVAPLGPGEVELGVMSLNILNGESDIHADPWDERKDRVLQRIVDSEPDLLGLQEALGFQTAYLREHLSDYGYVGAGRRDGEDEGERVAIFFRTDRFEKLDEGHFWLSSTPDTPGSKNRFRIHPRMVSWMHLRSREASDLTLHFFNTHFDPISRKARYNAAQLLRERIAEIAGEGPALVVGDFNAHAGKGTYTRLLAPDAEEGPQLIDSYRAVFPKRGKNEGTWHGPKGIRIDRRIDWILHTPYFRTIDAGIDTSRTDGKFPSDHYPVWATIRWPGEDPDWPPAR